MAGLIKALLLGIFPRLLIMVLDISVSQSILSFPLFSLLSLLFMFFVVIAGLNKALYLLRTRRLLIMALNISCLPPFLRYSH